MEFHGPEGTGARSGGITLARSAAFVRAALALRRPPPDPDPATGNPFDTPAPLTRPPFDTPDMFNETKFIEYKFIEYGFVSRFSSPGGRAMRTAHNGDIVIAYETSGLPGSTTATRGCPRI